MASSTTKPVATVRAIRLRLLSEKPSRYITAKVPSSETTVATAGTMVARRVRRNTLTTSTTSAIEIRSVISISCSEARIELVRSVATSRSILGRQLGAQLGQEREHAVDGLDHVGPGLAGHQHDHRRLAVEEAQGAVVLDVVAHLGHVGKAHRRAVAPGDDHGRVVGGAARRRLGVDLQPPPRALDRALGPVGVRGLDRSAHVLAADAVAVEGEGQQLDPHRRQRAAADLHVADALDLRQPLADDVRHRVVDLPRRQRLRGQRQDDHRRVGRIGLAVGRVRAQGRRQVDARGVDRRLHLARRAVDVARQLELQADAGAADLARRGHLVDAGDRAEAPLERRRHARRHGVGAGAGQLGADRDRRVVDLRQGRDRQHEEGADAGEGDADRQQDGGDRAADEGSGEVHARPSCSSS